MNRKERAMVLGPTERTENRVCCMCYWFFECRGMDFLDGDDYPVESRLYHEACGSFEPRVAPDKES